MNFYERQPVQKTESAPSTEKKRSFEEIFRDTIKAAGFVVDEEHDRHADIKSRIFVNNKEGKELGLSDLEILSVEIREEYANASVEAFVIVEEHPAPHIAIEPVEDPETEPKAH